MNFIQNVKNVVTNNSQNVEQLSFLPTPIAWAIKEIRSFTSELGRNSVGAYASGAAFFAITSFFPFMLLLMAMISQTPLESYIANALSDNIINTVTGEFVGVIMQEVADNKATIAILGTAGISALWAASRFILSIAQGLNRIYECDVFRNPENPHLKKKSWLKLRLKSIVYLLALLGIFVVALVVLVFGESINQNLAERLGLQELGGIVLAFRWLVVFLLLSVIFALSYTFIPRRKLKFRLQLVGAVFSSAGWLIFSWLFSLYVNNFASFDEVYGSLSTIVVLMLWLYFCMFILFMGAQINEYLRKKFVFRKLYS
ncbi:MAG: YihY/virulence factor BrkB family protein [Oscillospiraceae bacterium]|nr:YihY/virulence factor BrkB family protein [Oscillospiraceae bacterium]